MNELNTGRKNCDPCSKELNQTEADIYTSLIHWLELITCIPWIRAYSSAGSPETNVDNKFKEQYGIIQIESIENNTIERDGVIEIGETEHCIRLKIQSMVRAQLRVNNYSTCGFIRSPIDVLNHIFEIYKIVYEANDALCNAGISIQDFNGIRSVQSLENETTAFSATQEITFSITRYTSVAETLIHDIKILLDKCCQDNNNNNNMDY